MWRHYGSKIVGVFLRPFNETLSSTIDIYGIGFLFMEDCAPFIFLGS